MTQFVKITMNPKMADTDTGIDVTEGGRIVIFAEGSVNLGGNLGGSPAPWNDPTGIPGYFGNLYPPGRRGMLLGYIGAAYNPTLLFPVGKFYNGIATATGRLKLTLNEATRGAYGDNRGSFNIFVLASDLDAPLNWGVVDCHFGAMAGEVSISNPISLRRGDKREVVTDISLNTPASPLELVRSYTQSQQTELQFVGLGWTHNHAIKLTKITGSPNRVIVQLQQGGEAHFSEDTPDHYTGAPGVTSVVDWDNVSQEYSLTVPDGTAYVFDSAGILLTRTWANGETWTYEYSGNQLIEIEDDYGRQLVFRYYASGSFAGKLHRVGDHTFDDTNVNDPDGRYVEYSYSPNKVVDSSGAIVDGTDALLTQVRDVRGQTWNYTYYGHNSSETDVRQLNYLIQYQTPLVDTDGDGSGDEFLMLEDLTYAVQGDELVLNGTMEANSDWAAVGSPTQGQSSTQIESGSYAWYVDAADAEGIEGNTWDLVAGQTYILTARVYPISGTVKLQVSGDSSFDRSSTATSAWETLRVVYQPLTSSTGHRVQFIASSGAAEFYVDSVSLIETNLNIESIQQSRGNGQLITDFAFQPNGENVTTEEVAGLVKVHQFFGEVYGGTQEPGQDEHFNFQVQNDQYRPALLVDANDQYTELEWDSSGKHLDKVTDALKNETSFSYDSEDRLTETIDAQGRITEYTYGSVNAPRQPTVIKVYDSDGTTVLRWQEYTYDTKGRTTDERLVDPNDGVTILQQTTREYETNPGNGHGLLKKVTQTDIDGANDVTTTYTYDSAGRVVQVNQNTTFGNCARSRTVYDAAGNVIASLCNFEPGTINPIYPTTVAQAQELRQRLYNDQDADHYTDPNTNRLTLHVYDALGRRVQTIQKAEDLDDEQSTLTFYDALSRVVRTISNYDPQGSSAPGDWVWNAGATPEPRWEDGSGNAIDHGTDNTKNIIADTDYNARGMVRFQRDVLGNVTLLGYNDAGRLVKTIRNVSEQDYNNDYSGPSPDPDLSGYTFVSDPDQDIITLNEYDPVGNLVKTTDPLGQVSFTVYDALNRPVKTVRNAHANATVSLNPGDVGYDAAHDPRTAEYAISADPDRDQVSTTEYDSLGRVIRTQQLLENRDSTPAWMTTLYGYDALGRQVTSIRSASQPNYDITADPELSAYVASGASDLDIISTTTYSVEGRVLAATDVNGTLTRSVYDGLGRPVRTIASYIFNAEDPANWVWDATDVRWEQSDGTAIAHGSDNDENIISHTVYDDDGRVLETVDMLGRVTRQVYDDLGRQVRTVSNYVDNSYNDPADWVWESGQWKDAPAGTIISRGVHYDQNIVSTTEYDDQSRVWKTYDPRNNESRMVYDTLGRRIMAIANYVAQDNDQNNEPDSEPEDWVWDAGDGRWEDGAGTAIDHGSANDLNQISTTTYDIAGRVTASRDNAGLETRHEYDALGRQVKTVRNYIDGVYTPAAPDEDLASETLYNKAGQMIVTVDPRGTPTTFTYDAAGRQLSITQAAGTALASQSYTCYDKAGRVRRSIQNYLPVVDAEDEPILPDTYAAGIWAFNPTQHGLYQDQNLITEFVYDAASRQVQVIDPVGNTTATSYTQDGQVDTVTDAEGVETLYRYDQLRRRTRVVQGFVAQGSNDPAAWVWNAAATPEPRWEDGSNNAINHGANQDQNIIVDVTYDTAGRMLSLRNPLGHVTTYTYDALNRRLKLTNALAIPLPDPWGWITKYSDLSTGGTRVEQTYPGLSSGGIYTVERDFDRLGRLSTINYDSPTTTPGVRFSYDAAGNRQSMTEYGGTGFTNPVRETVYGYDALRRLTSVGFDTDGDSTVEETVSYAYDAGGLRTRLTLPGNLDITYVYDAKGQLVSLTDWDNQQTQMSYDQVGRHIATRRANGLRSRYSYDAASRLRKLRHSTSQRTLGHFEYQVDKRGNRTQTLEVLPHPVTTGDTLLTFDDSSLIYTGSWSDSSPFKVTDSASSSLKTLFYGSQIEFTFGVGPDHGLFDVYIGKTLYQSYDGYAVTPGERTESVSLTGEGPFLFEIRNRPEHNANATGYRLRFKQLLIPDVAYDLHAIDYTYDALSRLQQADYNSGERVYDFNYDLAGNRLSEALALNGGTPTVTSYSYNAANQLASDGSNTFGYDANGNLTMVNSFPIATWNRANRLLTAPGSTSYQYDGLGNRIQQTVSSIVTDYLLDTQPRLTVVLQQTTNSNTERFIHGARGIHAHQNPNGDWFYPVQDGLGSVRGVADAVLTVQGTQHYAPYGSPFGKQGSLGMSFGFTGEQTDANDLVYLRARYFSPALGVFANLDPFEGVINIPLSLNRFGYVEGNVINSADPIGLQPLGRLCLEYARGFPSVVDDALCGGINFLENFDSTLQGIGNAANQLDKHFNFSGPSVMDQQVKQGLFLGMGPGAPRAGTIPQDDDTLREIAEACDALCGAGLVWFLAQFGIDTQTNIQEYSNDRQNPCSLGPFSGMIKCEDPNLVSHTYSTQTSFDDVWQQIEVGSGERANTTVAYSINESQGFRRSDLRHRKPIGDIAIGGPCVNNPPPFEGRHWNVFSSSSWRLRQTTGRANPLSAIGKCSCCAVEDGRAVIHEAFAIVRPRF